MTIADQLTALVQARDTLKSNLEANGVETSSTTFPQLAADALNLAFGILHYATNSGILNKDGEYYPNEFHIITDFMPARFVICLPNVLAGAFSDTSEYKMVGRMTLTGLSTGSQEHDVELTTGTGRTETIKVRTVISQTNEGQYDLTVVLPITPVRCVFRGTFDWLACDAAFEGDYE